MDEDKFIKKVSDQKLNPSEEVESDENEEELNGNLELTDEIKELIEYYASAYTFQKQSPIHPLHVDSLASKFAVVYEKIRRVIDWKEEHLIRRTAIERSLKRRLLSKLSGITFLSEVSPEQMAEPFVLELIRGGYFGNDKISGDKVALVKIVLEKYLYVLSKGLSSDGVNPVDIKTKVQFYNWLLEIAACEIEELLAPPLMEGGIMKFMSRIISDRIEVSPEKEMTKDEINLQTYIAVQRALFNLDHPIVCYNVIKYKYPQWITNFSEIKEDITKNVATIWKDVENDLENKHRTKFFNICERYDAPFLILYDVLSRLSKNRDKMIEIFSSWQSLNKEIHYSYNKRLSTLKSRLQRSAIYSTLSILLSGIVSLIIIEGPVAKLVHGEFNLLAMAIDLLIPSAVMFILVWMIKLPDKKNYSVLANEAQSIIYKTDKKITYDIHLNKTRNLIKTIIFGFFYAIATVFSFGLVFWIFKIAKVPWTSLYIDTANIAVVVSAALIIKQRSTEVTIEESSRFGDFFLDALSIPLANLGQWLSQKWKEYNFVSVFFTTIVDMPVVMLLETIEEWRSFLKEKKSEIH